MTEKQFQIVHTHAHSAGYSYYHCDPEDLAHWTPDGYAQIYLAIVGAQSIWSELGLEGTTWGAVEESWTRSFREGLIDAHEDLCGQ